MHAGTPGKAVPTNPSNDSRFTESHSVTGLVPFSPTNHSNDSHFTESHSQGWFPPLPHVLLFADQYGVTGHRPLCRETDRCVVRQTGP